jgi:tetratricopeptide (TPR) repeat protein
MARRLGWPSTLADALSGYVNSHVSPDFAPQQVVLATELVEAAMQAGDLERATEGYQYRVESSIDLGDMTTVHSDLDGMTRLAEELRQPAQTWLAGLMRTHVALLEGRFTEAEQLLAETRSLGERVQGWEATMYHALQLYVLQRELGRVKEIDELIRRAVVEYPTYPVWRCVLTNMLAELGEPAEAHAELDTLAAAGFSGLPFDEEWEVSMCLLAEAAARLGDGDHALTLHELLLPYADRVAATYPEISLGPIARFLGLLASATLRWDDAERHFRSAIDLGARIGARPSLAHANEDYARMLLERGRPDDIAKASELVEQAYAGYSELGMAYWASRVAALHEKTLALRR